MTLEYNTNIDFNKIVTVEMMETLMRFKEVLDMIDGVSDHFKKSRLVRLLIDLSRVRSNGATRFELLESKNFIEKMFFSESVEW